MLRPKDKESSFSEEKEAKRLLFLVQTLKAKGARMSAFVRVGIPYKSSAGIKVLLLLFLQKKKVLSFAASKKDKKSGAKTPLFLPSQECRPGFTAC
jgi:hypothetical protein